MGDSLALLYLALDRFFILLVLSIAVLGWIAFFGHLIYTWATGPTPPVVTTLPPVDPLDSYETRPRLPLKPVTFTIDPFDQDLIATESNGRRVNLTQPPKYERAEVTRTETFHPMARSMRPWDEGAVTRIPTPKPPSMEWTISNGTLQTPRPPPLEGEEFVDEETTPKSWESMPRPGWYREK